MAWLEIKDLVACYHKVPVLHGVSLEVNEGSFVSVIGSNGAGKTTLLRSISGVVDITGQISLASDSCSQVGARECVRRGIIHCPEGRLLFPAMTVLQNLMMGAFLRRDKENLNHDLERVFHYLPVLAERRTQTAGTLSGGEQQMVAVGRAIMGKPRLLTLDEPSFGLAPLVVATIFEVILGLNQEGVTVLLVEQNAALALEYSNYTYVLEEGAIIDQGPSRELGDKESVARAYLGMT